MSARLDPQLHDGSRPASRRSFLWSLAGSAAALGTSSCGDPSDASRQTRHRAAGRKLQAVRHRTAALGTSVEITAYHADPNLAQRAIDAAFTELEQVESVMSLYRSGSQLCRLNRHKRLDRADRRLLEVLRTAKQVSRRTAGAFDVTVQPLWNLFAQAARRQTTPAAGEVAQVVRAVDYRRVEIDGRSIRLRGTDTEVTLNGIAQGYALDRVAAVLQSHGIRHALFDTGEIGGRGNRADGEPWKIGIQHPRRTDAYIAMARLDGRCLATSGDYATTFSADRTAHHLFDPRTGGSPAEIASVTVAAPTGILADALSTAICVLGIEHSERVLAGYRNCDALFVLRDGRVLHTDRFPLETS